MPQCKIHIENVNMTPTAVLGQHTSVMGLGGGPRNEGYLHCGANAAYFGAFWF